MRRVARILQAHKQRTAAHSREELPLYTRRATSNQFQALSSHRGCVEVSDKRSSSYT
jgi:hypothetical protein